MIANENKIKLAKYAGFCHGVKRAVDLTIKVKKDNPNKSVYILGQLIHNNQVIEQLSAIGIQTVYNINEIPDGSDNICIIRTHGATPETIAELEAKGCQIVDATCPDVKRVQNKARALAEEGYQVLIVGKPDHPEVIAIKANADLSSQKNNTLVISSKEEVFEHLEAIKKAKRVGIVIQTTQKIENLKEILPFITENSKELKVFNTICPATSNRQKSAKELAKESDLMIVVGSKSSANTTHLAEILNEVKKTIHIETKDDLKAYIDIIKKADNIGVTAGASTPDEVIKNVIEKIGEK